MPACMDAKKNMVALREAKIQKDKFLQEGMELVKINMNIQICINLLSNKNRVLHDPNLTYTLTLQAYDYGVFYILSKM